MVNKLKAREILAELEARFLDGERLSIGNIVTEYLQSSSTLNYLLGKDSVKRWLTTLKRRFWVAHHVWSGNLNDLGQYGICDTEAEYKYSLIRYFSFIKGNVTRAVQLRDEAVNRGLLLKDFKQQTFLLPGPIIEEKVKEKRK